MTSYELASVLIAFLSLILAILALASQSINGIKSWTEANNANEIAKRALEISQIALDISKDKHRMETIPEVNIDSIILIFDAHDPAADIIDLFIKNAGKSEIRIDKLEIRGHFKIVQSSTSRIPVTLGFNNDVILRLSFSHEKIRANLLKQVIAKADLGTTEHNLVKVSQSLLNQLYVSLDLTETKLNNRYHGVRYGNATGDKLILEQQRNS